MKVYVVKCIDTNCITTLDKIFLNKRDAEQYVENQKKNDELIYYISEHPVMTNGEKFCHQPA